MLRLLQHCASAFSTHISRGISLWVCPLNCYSPGDVSWKRSELDEARCQGPRRFHTSPTAVQLWKGLCWKIKIWLFLMDWEFCEVYKCGSSAGTIVHFTSYQNWVLRSALRWGVGRVQSSQLVNPLTAKPLDKVWNKVFFMNLTLFSHHISFLLN